jgi:TatD DNase family protein
VRFVDSHLHLSDEGNTALANANETLLVVCGVDEETSGSALRAARGSTGTVRAFVGIHPSEAEKEESLDWIREAIREATGVGEIGLDPKYSRTGEKSTQMKVFRGQLEAAARAGKPVQVHSRDAERECLDVLGSYDLRGVLMHWYQGEAFLQTVVQRGYYVSVGPAVIYSKRVQRMAEVCGPSMVLTETDSPVRYKPLGGAAGPSLIPSIVFKLSEAWNMGFEEARQTVVDDSLRFLKSGEKG